MSRNSLRFSFAPLILFLPFLEWNLRYAWSRPQNAVSWFRLLSASVAFYTFVLLCEAWLSLSFHVYFSYSFSLSLSSSCMRVILLAIASSRFEMRLDRRVRWTVFEPLTASPFASQPLSASTLCNEDTRGAKGTFCKTRWGVWGRPDSETFLARPSNGLFKIGLP